MLVSAITNCEFPRRTFLTQDLVSEPGNNGFVFVGSTDTFLTTHCLMGEPRTRSQGFQGLIFQNVP